MSPGTAEDTGRDTLSARALAASAAIADRLADPAAVPRGPGRKRGQSLAGGAAGIALLHLERARTSHGDPAVANAWLRAATRDPASAGPNASLYFGAPTLAFVLDAAGRPDQLTKALTTLDTATIAVTQRRLAEAGARLRAGRRPPLAEFDLIRGLAGLGRYHLRRQHPIIGDVLTHLVRLTQPLAHGDGLPGWWTDLDPSGASSNDYPHGHGNAGMSHGIAACLALLALASSRGTEVDGHREAIERICAWLDGHQQPGIAGWPGIVTPTPSHDIRRQRLSWCYGAPGIARAYQLAGLATGDPRRCERAEIALRACLDDAARLDLTTDIGLCHGLAGLVHTTSRVTLDAAAPELAWLLPTLVARLLDQYPTAPHDPELLDGLAGVALALHTAALGSAPVTGWDAALLLA